MPIVAALEASSAITGGGVTYLAHLLPRLLGFDDFRLAVMMAPRALLADLDLPPDTAVITARGRLGALGSSWRSACQERGVNVVWNPSEIYLGHHGDQPLVAMIRNSNLFLPPLAGGKVRLKRTLQKALAARTLRQAATCIAVSRHAADLAAETISLPYDKIQVIYHGGPPDLTTGQRRTGSRLLIVSDLHRHKNVEVVLHALGTLTQAWTLTIVGSRSVDHTYATSLETLVRQYQIEDRVVFAGSLRGKRLTDAYGEHDCLLWPSARETFGHPPLEALSHGLSVLSSSAPCPVEILGDAASYFDETSIDSVRHRIDSYLADRSVPVNPLPRRYSWDTCATETFTALSNVAL